MSMEVTLVFRDDDPQATPDNEDYEFWLREYLERHVGINVMSVETEEV